MSLKCFFLFQYVHRVPHSFPGDIICSPRSKAIKSDYADKFQKESAEWTSYLSNVTADQQKYVQLIDMEVFPVLYSQ